MPPRTNSRRSSTGEKVRYAVVGLGHIAQTAVLPAFQHARRNSELAALVSGSQLKLTRLQRKYRVEYAVDYDQYEDLLQHGDIDAVYIALPNDLHYEYTLRAAAMGVHVLCEKPLALSERDCEEMIQATREAGVRLMTAYRLHFDEATLDAIELVRSGRIGEPRLFSGLLTMQVKDRQNIRLDAERGGGPLWDLGVYCINAARSLFGDEPVAVEGLDASGGGERFREVPEMSCGLLRFPRDRVAMIGCSFGAADASVYRIIGTQGELKVEPAFEYAEGLAHRLTIDERTTRRRYGKSDQFGAELVAFSECVLEGRDPEPSGSEGLADVRVIRALIRSSREGRAISLPPFRRARRPDPDQEIRLPPVRRPPREVAARSPSG
jgi:glucose-fructose oxidoreductase